MSHRDKGYGVVVMINANQPDFFWELIGSVARAYNWDGYIPTFPKLVSDAATLEQVSGRYRTGHDEVATIYHTGARLFRQYNAWDPEELFRISDSTYISRDDDHPVQFKQAVGDSAATMVTLNEEDGSVVSSDPRMSDTQHVPFEFVLAGKPEEAVTAYRALMVSSPKDQAVHEQRLNSFGF